MSRLSRSPVRRLATALVAALCAQETSCGGPSEPKKTCVVPNVSYQGSAGGPAFLEIRGDHGLQMGSGGVSFLLLANIVNGKAFCFVTTDPSPQVLDATAWIDEAGASAVSCADIASVACQPSPGDPQVHRTAELLWGEVKIIALQIPGP